MWEKLLVVSSCSLYPNSLLWPGHRFVTEARCKSFLTAEQIFGLLPPGDAPLELPLSVYSSNSGPALRLQSSPPPALPPRPPRGLPRGKYGGRGGVPPPPPRGMKPRPRGDPGTPPPRLNGGLKHQWYIHDILDKPRPTDGQMSGPVLCTYKESSHLPP